MCLSLLRGLSLLPLLALPAAAAASSPAGGTPAAQRQPGQAVPLLQQELDGRYVALPLPRFEGSEDEALALLSSGTASSLDAARAAELLASSIEGLPVAARVLALHLARNPSHGSRSGSRRVDGRVVLRRDEPAGHAWSGLARELGSGTVTLVLELALESVDGDPELGRRLVELVERRSLRSPEQARLAGALLRKGAEVHGPLLGTVARTLELEGLRYAEHGGAEAERLAEVLAPELLGVLRQLIEEGGQAAEGAIDLLGAFGCSFPDFAAACREVLSSTAGDAAGEVRAFWEGMLAALARGVGEPLPDRYVHALTELAWWSDSWPRIRRPIVVAGAEALFWEAVTERSAPSAAWIPVADRSGTRLLPERVALQLVEAGATRPFSVQCAVLRGFGVLSDITTSAEDGLAAVAALALMIQGLPEGVERDRACSELLGLLRSLPASMGAGPHDYTRLGIGVLDRAGMRHPAFVELALDVLDDFWGFSTDTRAAAGKVLASVELGEEQRQRLARALDRFLLIEVDHPLIEVLGEEGSRFLPALRARARRGDVAAWASALSIAGPAERDLEGLAEHLEGRGTARSRLDLLGLVERFQLSDPRLDQAVRALRQHPAPEVREAARRAVQRQVEAPYEGPR